LRGRSSGWQAPRLLSSPARSSMSPERSEQQHARQTLALNIMWTAQTGLLRTSPMCRLARDMTKSSVRSGQAAPPLRYAAVPASSPRLSAASLPSVSSIRLCWATESG
jgi:hypothetical protein